MSERKGKERRRDGRRGRRERRTELDTDYLVESSDQRSIENDEGVEEVGVGGDGLEDELGEGGGDVYKKQRKLVSNASRNDEVKNREVS